ncbi:MAG: hypothetical protein JW774_03245 [Candidatus Aureabacteria bacterium]|nr:hypothetical protein [Candidatus Auribacterota bacterium]
MKKFTISLWILVLSGISFFCLAVPGDGYRGPSDEGIDRNQIRKALAHHGRWGRTDRYHEVWIPHVRHGWRPYTYGHWIYTDFGWMWISDEEWGWIPFHYGWWVYDVIYGWVWVPGYVWGPAWVSWRYGDGYIGWAPLPPCVYWDPYYGMRYHDGWENQIPYHGWCFIKENRIMDPQIHRHIRKSERNPKMLKRTRRQTRYEFHHNHVVNRGVDLDRLQKQIGREVPHFRILEEKWEEGKKPVIKIDKDRIYFPKPVNFPSKPIVSSPQTAPVTKPSGTPSETIPSDKPIIWRSKTSYSVPDQKTESVPGQKESTKTAPVFLGPKAVYPLDDDSGSNMPRQYESSTSRSIYHSGRSHSMVTGDQPTQAETDYSEEKQNKMMRVSKGYSH